MGKMAYMLFSWQTNLFPAQQKVVKGNFVSGFKQSVGTFFHVS